MTPVIERLKRALAGLPETDQEALAAELEKHAEACRLRAMIDEGRAELDRGAGKPYDMAEIMAEARAQYGAG